MDLTNPLIYGVPCFIAFILLEFTYSKTKGNKDIYSYKDFAASFSMGLGTAIINPLVKIVSLIFVFNLVYDIFNPVVNGVHTNIMGYASFGYAWYIWLACQFLDDLTYYWFHRFNHTIRFLWAAHIVHHSSNKFNLGTAVRNGWFTVMYKPFFYMWLAAIGFPVPMIVVCMAIESLWQFQLHSQYVPKMGIIEKVFNTHTMHQVHHAQNIEYLDKNHGGFLNIFDRMFGTWKELDETQEVKYGVVHAPDSYNPLVILTHEYSDIWRDIKKSKNFKEAFMYTFGEPGWSPDGSTLTVKQLQKLHAENKLDEDWTSKA